MVLCRKCHRIKACLEKIAGHFCSWWVSWTWSLLFSCTNKQEKSQRWHKNVTENVMFSKSKIITLSSKFHVIEQQKACWELNKTIISAVSTFRGIKTNGSFSLNDCDQGLCTRNAGEENRRRGSRLPGHADHRGPSSLLSVCSAHPRDSGPGERKPTQISPTILLWIYSKGFFCVLRCCTIWTRWETCSVWSSRGRNIPLGPTSVTRSTTSWTADTTPGTLNSQRRPSSASTLQRSGARLTADQQAKCLAATTFYVFANQCSMLIIVRETQMYVCIGNYLDPSNECTAMATFLRKKPYMHCVKYILFQGLHSGFKMSFFSRMKASISFK